MPNLQIQMRLFQVFSQNKWIKNLQNKVYKSIIIMTNFNKMKLAD